MKRPPRQVSVRAATYEALKQHAQTAGLTPSKQLDQLIVAYLDAQEVRS